MNMSKIKRFAVIIAILALVVMIMTACGGSNPPVPSATIPASSTEPSTAPSLVPSASVAQSAEPSIEPSIEPSGDPSTSSTPADKPTGTVKPTATPKPTATQKPKPTEAPAPDIADFSTTDLNGNTITNSVFSKAPLTMINVWATWCQPCIEELPSIQELSSAFSGKMQVISILFDSSDPGAIDNAKAIIQASGVQFPVLKNNKSVKSAIMDKFGISTLPTTLFINSNGNLVTQPIIGAKSYVEWTQIINGLLK
ncbi:MAG: redoxin domain-containing protein [Clostridia bacterium]